MSYIAFVDMIGTRASATISHIEYTDAINNFNNALKQCVEICPCKCTVFGYSDNAYIQVENLSDMIYFFRDLRDHLMKNHRYFSAAIDSGSLDAQYVNFKNKMNSLKFTAPKAVDIYMAQSHFSGIGISLSQRVIDELIHDEKNCDFCQSIFIPSPSINLENRYASVFDISYENVVLEQLEYVLADYLITAATNARAGRYYVTPIISMIKSLDINTIQDDLQKLVSLISFDHVPNEFKGLSQNSEYSLLFVFALIDFVISSIEKKDLIDAVNICEKITTQYGSTKNIIWVEQLSHIPESVMSCGNKRIFLNIIYNMRQQTN